MSNKHDSLTTILFAQVAHGLIAVAKGVAAWITGSTSMSAETAHSLADCGNRGLLLWGMRVSARPPRELSPTRLPAGARARDLLPVVYRGFDAVQHGRQFFRR